MVNRTFLAYGQHVSIKIDIIKLDTIFKPGQKLELVIKINKKVTTQNYQIKREIVDTNNFKVFCRQFVHNFPVMSYSQTEKDVVGAFWTFEIYVDDKCIVSKSKEGVTLCERKKYVERLIACFLERDLHYQINYLSDSDNPDLIIRDLLCNSEIQCEITEKTNPLEELSYEKFASDIEKYERYKREGRYPNVRHLLIISCSKGIASKVKKHQRDFVTVITYNDLINLLKSLKNKSENIYSIDTVKKIITNSGIQKAPKKYSPQTTPYDLNKVLRYKLDLQRKNNDNLEVQRHLLYIRDINPFEVIKIAELAKKYHDEYYSKTKFKSILLEKENLNYINQKRTEASKGTNYGRIDKEWWLITPIQLGYLDSNCKITDKGLLLLDIIKKRDEALISRAMGYDLLNASGIREFLKVVNKCYKNQFYIRHPSSASFFQVLKQTMKEKGLASTEANAIKDSANIFRWLIIFKYASGYHLNLDNIKNDWNLVENGDK